MCNRSKGVTMSYTRSPVSCSFNTAPPTPVSEDMLLPLVLVPGSLVLHTRGKLVNVHLELSCNPSLVLSSG